MILVINNKGAFSKRLLKEDIVDLHWISILSLYISSSSHCCHETAAPSIFPHIYIIEF